MRLDHVPMNLVGTLAHGASYGVLQPPLKVLPDGHATCVEDEASVSVGHRFGELLTRFLTGLAGDVAPPRDSSRVDGVGAPVADLLTVPLVLVYRAFSVTVL